MAKLGDFFHRKFNKHNLMEVPNGYKINIDYGRLGKRLDYAQKVLDEQVWQDVQTYMPFDSGNLIAQTNMLNAVTTGKVYLYPPDSDYGHYQYMGVVYVDPVYGVAGWRRKDGTWYSRKDVKKIPSERRLDYVRPTATPEWGKTAIKNHANEWRRLVKRASR